jgi:hypothetical protein
VSDKHIVFNVHTFTNKAVTRNFAVLADSGALLYFHECPHLAAIIDAAAVGIYEVENLYVLANLYVVERLLIVVDGDGFHRRN